MKLLLFSKYQMHKKWYTMYVIKIGTQLIEKKLKWEISHSQTKQLKVKTKYAIMNYKVKWVLWKQNLPFLLFEDNKKKLFKKIKKSWQTKTKVLYLKSSKGTTY